MMRTPLFAGALIVALGAPALAADLPIRGGYEPLPPRPVYNWTGCSVGVNIGGGWATKGFRDTGGTFGAAGGDLDGHTASGALGGAQAACDYQIGVWVVGGQGLFDAAGLKRSNYQPSGLFLNNTYIPWIATLTGRVGVTLDPTLLLYVRGGGAWAHDTFSLTSSVFNNSTVATGQANPAGWTVGAGVEWAILANLSLFAEVDYMDFGTPRVTFTATSAVLRPTFPLDIRQKVSLFQLGINYRFAAASLFGRY